MRAQIQQAPDSIVKTFVRSLARNELLLKQADSAKIQLDSAELSNLRHSFTSALTQSWSGLGVTAASMKDSAKSEADREKLAATRIEGYLDKLTQQRAEFVQVPVPIERAIRTKYEWKVNDAGLDRALERAATVRASRDSSRAAGQPPTAVPMPPTQGAPVPTPPAPAPSTKRP